MHFCNFFVNIQPDPVKMLQLTSPYWDDWAEMGYNLPDGCLLVTQDSNMTHLCTSDAFTIPEGVTLPVDITLCEACFIDNKYIFVAKIAPE